MWFVSLMSFNIFELFEKPKSFGIQEALNSNLTESFLWLWSGGQSIDHPLNFSLSGFPDHAGDVNLNLTRIRAGLWCQNSQERAVSASSWI